MILFGITLKHFAKLQELGDKAKGGKRLIHFLEKKSDKVFRTRDIMEMKVSDYVDLEIYHEEGNFIEFCRIFVVKRFWQTIYLHNLWKIKEDFAKKRNEMYKKYYYIFNPPQYGTPGEVTLGSELREGFVEEFGNWVVLTDAICKGRLVDYKTVESWKMSEFLFWANYLSGQKIIENVK